MDKTSPEYIRRALLRDLTDHRPYSISEYRLRLRNAREFGIIYEDLESFVGCNRYYLSRIVKEEDYYPNERICGILGIHPQEKTFTACTHCGQVHRSVKTCGASRSAPGRRMIDNPTLEDLAAAYRNVIKRNNRRVQ